MWPGWVEANPGLAAISEFLRSVPELYFVGALAFVAYLLGAVLLAFSDAITNWVTRVAGVVSQAMLRALGYRRLLAPARRFLSQTHDPAAVRGPVGDSISAAYAKAGAPPNAHFAFPLELVLDRFDATALQLWQKSPSQYQEYDRLRAESNFRTGVSIPLVAIAVVIAIRVSWVVLPVAIVAAAVLLVQARKFENKRDALIANAFYQGLVEDPLLKAVTEEIPAMKIAKQASSPAWYAVTAVALSKWGEFDGMETVIRLTVREIFETLEFREVSRENYEHERERLAAEVDDIFWDNDEIDLQKHFRRRLDDRVQRVA